MSYPHKAFFPAEVAVPPVSLLCDRVAAGNSFMFSSKRFREAEKNGTFTKLICIKSTTYCAQHSHITTVKKGTNYYNLKEKKKKHQGIM